MIIAITFTNFVILAIFFKTLKSNLSLGIDKYQIDFPASSCFLSFFVFLQGENALMAGWQISDYITERLVILICKHYYFIQTSSTQLTFTYFPDPSSF